MSQEQINKMNAIDESLTHLYKTVDKIAEDLAKIKSPMIYNYVDENMPEWARDAVKWAVDNKILNGDENGLNLDDKDLRYITMLLRMRK